MADEAKLTIVIEDAGAGGSSPPPADDSSSPTPPTQSSTPSARPPSRGKGSAYSGFSPGGVPLSNDQFDALPQSAQDFLRAALAAAGGTPPSAAAPSSQPPPPPAGSSATPPPQDPAKDARKAEAVARKALLASIDAEAKQRAEVLEDLRRTTSDGRQLSLSLTLLANLLGGGSFGGIAAALANLKQGVDEFKLRTAEAVEREAKKRDDAARAATKIPTVHPPSAPPTPSASPPTAPPSAKPGSGAGSSVPAVPTGGGAAAPAAEAEAGAVGAEGLAAAAGPIGLIAVAALTIAKKIDDLQKAAIEGTRQVATAAGTALAHNDTGALFDQVSEGASKLGNAIGTVVPGMGFLTDSTIALAKTFRDVTAAFLDRARELSAYQGNLAGATARAGIQELVNDIREAQQLGPGLARLTDANAELQTLLRDLLLPIKKVVVEVLGNVAENIADIIKVLRKMGADTEKLGQTAKDTPAETAAKVALAVAGGLPGILIFALGKFFGPGAPPPAPNDLDEFLALFRQGQPFRGGPLPRFAPPALFPPPPGGPFP